MKLPNRQLKPHLHLPLQLLPLHPPSSLLLRPSRLPPQQQSPAPAAPAAMATEQSGALIWCCQLGHPNDVPSYVPFFTAVSDHFGSKEPLLWRERAPIPQIGALNMDQSLAESWEVSPDQTSITFKIRQGVPFHKGWGEVTAEDVAWSFNNAKSQRAIRTLVQVSGVSTPIGGRRLTPTPQIMHVKGNLSVRWSCGAFQPMEKHRLGPEQEGV